MHNWLALSGISTNKLIKSHYEESLKFFFLDEKVVKTQPVINGRKLEDLVSFAFHGQRDYAQSLIRCISK